MSRAAVAHASTELNERFDLPEVFDPKVALDRLVENGHNARTKFDEVKLNELADSIRTKGVVEPLVVRPIGKGDRLEIVAGARRRRASKIAGRTHVPCVIREYSDEDVLEIQIIENIQREDLDPLDEAAGYKALIESNKAKYSAAYIADRIGRREAYVWDTLRLLGLIEDAKALLDQGRLTRTHAVTLARLTPADQKRLIAPTGALWTREHVLPLTDQPDKGKWAGLKAVSVRELEAHIADHVRFNLTHAATTAPMEFSQVAQQVEAALAQPGRGKKVIPITHLAMVPADAKDENERTFTAASWKRADGQHDSKECEHSVLGVIAVGHGQGSTFDVCTAKDTCQVHWLKEQKEKAKAQKLRETGKADQAQQRQQQQQERDRQEREREEAARARYKAAQPAILEALAANLRKAKPWQLADIVINGCDNSHDQMFKRTAQRHLSAKRRPEDIIRLAALVVLCREVGEYNAHVHFPRVGKRFGVDVGKILKVQAKKGK